MTWPLKSKLRLHESKLNAKKILQQFSKNSNVSLLEAKFKGRHVCENFPETKKFILFHVFLLTLQALPKRLHFFSSRCQKVATMTETH